MAIGCVARNHSASELQMIFEAGTGSFGRRSISELFLNSFQ